MKKEIVIAAHVERIDWLPERWRPYTTIYRCGEPSRPSAHKANRHHHHGGDNDLYAQLEKLRAVLEFVREVAAISKDAESVAKLANHAEKQTANCPKGREAEQWLNHIIWRYDTLADVTVFLQGHPHDHCHDFIEVVDGLAAPSFVTIPRGEPVSAGGESEFGGKFWAALGQVELKKVWWRPGAQFAASKDVIRSRPLDWYEKVQALARKTDRSGEILERTWWNILGCPC
jgi:hypothetical protein